jgi:hypothetical protein
MAKNQNVCQSRFVRQALMAIKETLELFTWEVILFEITTPNTYRSFLINYRNLSLIKILKSSIFLMRETVVKKKKVSVIYWGFPPGHSYDFCSEFHSGHMPICALERVHVSRSLTTA